MYKVVTIDEFGLCVIQQDGFKTSAEAHQEVTECIERWGEQDFWVEPYELSYCRFENTARDLRDSRVYNNNAVDGWEDLYPLEEY
jgi:hypothetical protein